MPTVAFKTLGCRLNQAESDSMVEQLSARGVTPVAAEGGSPDIVVVNTCTVTSEATKASRSALRRAAREHPRSKIVAVGCYAASDPHEVEAIEGVDLVLGNGVKESFAEELALHDETAALMDRGGGEPLLQIGMRPSAERPLRRVRANLKVQTGCDEWCSFCIIPRTRGPLHSMHEHGLIDEARRRVAAGAREIVLTGVHLGKYGYDGGGDDRDLVRLLRRLLDIDGVWRIRLSSILSNHLSPELIELMAGEPRICRHLHVPLQSGDDGVLQAMNRPYRIEDYVAAVGRAKGAIPGLALATDIIVGFPGESEAAFCATMDVVREIEFSKLHVFRYSTRPQTTAADMSDAVDHETKRDRSKRLIDLGNQIRQWFLAAHLHRPLEVLVEEERVSDGVDVCSGQTDDYVRVRFEAKGLLGSMTTVEGRRVRADGIAGHLVDGNHNSSSAASYDTRGR
jgi:threonylcarbamoyladenosine tRNA methylthiotransferase MtaB